MLLRRLIPAALGWLCLGATPAACSDAGDERADGPALLLVYEIEGAGADHERVADVVRLRLEETEVDDVDVALADGRIRVRLFDFEAIDRAKQVIGLSGELSFHLVASDDPDLVAQARADETALDPGLMIVPTRTPDEPFLLVERELREADTVADAQGGLVAALSGDHIARSSAGADPFTGEPVIDFAFDDVGREIFTLLTTNHVGERFAVVLDGEVITAPRVMTPIPGGSGFISGDFTREEASTLAALLRAGALPVPLVLIEERVDDPPSSSDAEL